MFRSAKNLKVFYSIVLLVFVFVVYNLISIKKPSKMVFNYSSMMKNIVILRSVRVIPNNAVIVVTFAYNLLNVPQ